MTVKTVNVKLRNELNPTFYKVWYSDKPYNILNGGRNSFKSSTISLKLVFDLMEYASQGKEANIIILRKTATTIRDSVFLKIKWALEKCGVLEQFTDRVSPYKWTHTATGSSFYFYGQDDFEKLKSSAVGNIIAVWYEEASEFSGVEEFDQTNITFMRQCHPDQRFVKFYWSYNPPRNQYNWINKWAEDCKGYPDYLVHTSTYQDDERGFVTEQMLRDIERVKANDYEYYRYLYLGEPVGLGTNVYNYSLFRRITEIPEDEYVLYLLYGLDTGHQQSATACICVGVTNRRNLILLDTYYYSPERKTRKLAPDEQSSLLYQFVQETSAKYAKPIRTMTIDSAEGAIRNQYYKDYNVRWNPVKKQKKVTMVDYVVILLAQGRVQVIDKPSNELFLEQHRDYRWNERTIYTDTPEVIKEDDHLPDAFQYLVCDNLRELGLIW